MTRKLFALLFTGSLAFLYSCQKETSFEIGQLAKGSLANSNGDCAPMTVSGTYVTTHVLGDTNTLAVTVNVAQIGAYTVYTDTINGYYFRATGNFNTVGPQLVTLKGFGTPTAAGTDHFGVIFDSGFCSVPITVITPGGSSGGSAAFTLQPGSSSCMSATVGGTYNAGTPTTASNKVDIQVNVTTPGTWTLATSTVDGFSYAGAGTFTATGVQTITLFATGTPTSGGTINFPVTAGSTNCSFNVTVAGTPPSTNHIILTLNSWWSHATPIAGDTLKATNVSTASFSGFTYTRLKELNTTGAIDDTLYFRKSGNNYYELNVVDWYSSVSFDNVVVDSILMMKEGLTTGQTWTSAAYSGTVSSVPTKIRYDFACTDAAATVNFNGNTYTNVYKVTMTPMINVANAGYQPDVVSYENWYAAGIGWIYQKIVSPAGTGDFPIRYYQVF